MRDSRSEFHSLRGLRLHLRRWGREGAPKLVLLHGFLDVSASFQFLVEALLARADYEVLAPDARGFGESSWPADGYWFPDYYGDLEALWDAAIGDTPCHLVGHSMGAQIASIYAGLRPQRVQRLVCMDGLMLPDMPASVAPKRMRAWLDQLRNPTRTRSYGSYESLAERIRKHHPRLSAERAAFVAQCWGEQRADGRIWLRADPRHEWRSPLLFHVEDSMSVWREVTAPTLFLDAAVSPFMQAAGAEEMARRRACFRQYEHRVVADSGHMLHFDQPEATATQVADFLDKPIHETITSVQ